VGFRLNLTGDEIKQAQGGGFPVLPAGTYGAVIYNNNQKNSKAGNPMFEIDYKIVEGPAGVGRRIRAWYVLSGKGLFKLVELNKATGFPYPDKDTPAGEFEFPDADEYHGKRVNIKITQEPYETVATADDVTNGLAEKVDDDITKQRNVVNKVLEYDADEITSADDLENDTQDAGAFSL
jgi:hypothetical protein